MRQLGVYLVTAMTAVTGAALVATVPASAATQATVSAQTTATATEYIVLQDAGSGALAAKAAVEKAGGTVVSENTELGYVVARSSNAGFQAAVNADRSVVGAAANRIIGQAPKEQQASQFQVEKLRAAAKAVRHGGGEGASSEPLADLQWDMKQIDATKKGSYA